MKPSGSRRAKDWRTRGDGSERGASSTGRNPEEIAEENYERRQGNPKPPESWMKQTSKSFSLALDKRNQFVKMPENPEVCFGMPAGTRNSLPCAKLILGQASFP